MSQVSKYFTSIISFTPGNNPMHRVGTIVTVLQIRKGGRRGLGDLAKVQQLASNRVRTGTQAISPEPMFLTLYYVLSLSLSHLICTMPRRYCEKAETERLVPAQCQT